ncbi:MAG TPA: hypothetical protein VMY42_25750 [Thermoguttaceae bacterium]|nr:hypothetical protein [Thermoguttaceae bacterium]
MSWPLASHFSAMLQNPKVAFRDPKLKDCRIEKDERKQPRPWAGAFAVVYKGIGADGQDPFAVRVFTTESPERRERYDLISAYLKNRRLDCLVDFEYRDRSIRSAGDGKWYPLIIMEWVQGETLFRWVRARCLEGNGPALAQAAKYWVELVKELAEASVAHGDLQQANVMVTTAGRLKLVDYDCMCVPALVGRRNLEVGVEPYQHPGRNETTLLSLDLDNFSALMIYIALRALSAAPQIWPKYVEQTGYDKLLFRPEDFQAPGGSLLYHDLMNSPEEDVRELTAKLFAFSAGPMDQVPPLSHLANSFAKMEQLLVRGEWKAAVDALNRRGQFRDAPAHLKPLIEQAYQHVYREKAWVKYCRVPRETSEANDRRLVDTWNEALFAGFESAERERVRIGEARRRVTMLDRIYHLVQQSAGAITLGGERRIVEAAAQLPQGYKYALQARVEQAGRRVQVLSRLEKAIDHPGSEAAIVAAWRAVVEAKCDHLVDPVRRPRIELAERRAPALRMLHEISGEMPPDRRDRQALEAWQEDLLGECEEAQPFRPLYQQAAARSELLERLRAAVDAHDEQGIVRLMEEPSLAGYPLPAPWTASVKAVQQRIGRTEALLAALEEDRRSSFCELFDARLIRRYADRFAPYQALLSEWTVREVLPPEKMGLRPALGRASLLPVKESPGEYRVRWTWPQSRFADECLLAVCPEQPGPEDDPQSVPAHFRQPIDRQNWESGGGSRVVRTEGDWAGSFVVAWAVVNLGFRTFFSRPLVLGQLETRSRSRWLGLRAFSSRRGETSPKPREDEPQ